MPWQEKSAERLRMEFVVAHQSQQYSFTELCELFGISREAGYGKSKCKMQNAKCRIEIRCCILHFAFCILHLLLSPIPGSPIQCSKGRQHGFTNQFDVLDAAHRVR